MNGFTDIKTWSLGRKMEETMTACATCNPPAPGAQRLSEAHVGVRFRDNRRGKWTVRLDGEDVTKRCTEALAGEPGWALLFVRDVWCSSHRRTKLHVGHVHVQCTPHPRKASDLGLSSDS